MSTDREPVAFHGNGVDFFSEIYHSYWANTVTDYTPLSENAALAAIRLDVQYLGLAFNEIHQQKLRERLVDRVFRELTDAESNLYEPMAHAELVDGKKTPEDPAKNKKRRVDGKVPGETPEKGNAKAKVKRKAGKDGEKEKGVAALSSLLNEMGAEEDQDEEQAEIGDSLE